MFVLASGCAACILLRGSGISPVKLGMMLQYLLSLQTMLKSTMSSFGEIQRKMVAVQRLFDLEKIPQEIAGQPMAKEWIAEQKVSEGALMQFK